MALHNEVHKLREELRAQQEQTCKLRTRLQEITGSRRFAFMRTLFSANRLVP